MRADNETDVLETECAGVIMLTLIVALIFSFLGVLIGVGVTVLCVAAGRAPDAGLQERLATLSVERGEIERLVDDLTGGQGDECVALPERIRREFADFRMVMDHCSEIYMHVSDGRISKPNTLPSEVIAISEDLATQETAEAVREATNEAEVVGKELAVALGHSADFDPDPREAEAVLAKATAMGWFPEEEKAS